jgi:hypothetical protein
MLGYVTTLCASQLRYETVLSRQRWKVLDHTNHTETRHIQTLSVATSRKPVVKAVKLRSHCSFLCKSKYASVSETWRKAILNFNVNETHS